MDWLSVDKVQPMLQAILGLLLLGVGAIVLQWLLRVFVMRPLLRLGAAQNGIFAVLLHREVLRRFVQIVPPFVVYLGIRLVPHLPEVLWRVVENVALALTVLAVARVLFRMLDAAMQMYAERGLASSGHVRTRSIKMYIQGGQLFIGLASLVIMVAALSDKSPLIVMSGLGAMSAVLMLIFQDTIRSFAAGVQIEGNDMLRVGDWIEMPQAGADGTVIDVALNTVKVQNWDKTIVTIPTWKLMSDSFKNWRGMSESGARRIKRALQIDAGSIHFLSDEEIARLGRIKLVADYMREKRDAVRVSRAMVASELGQEMGSVPINQRRLTNVGTYRAYALAYLKAHHFIRQDLTVMVRMMQPTDAGIPLELYCFTNITNWTDYEAIQSDIFDHLLAVLPEFGLRVFQNPSGGGISDALAEWRALNLQQVRELAAVARAAPGAVAPESVSGTDTNVDADTKTA